VSGRPTTMFVLSSPLPYKPVRPPQRES
jgi:hypothetical protein